MSSDEPDTAEPFQPLQPTNSASSRQPPLPTDAQPPPTTSLQPSSPHLSKNAQKRLRKQQEWESGRADRRLKRREKRHAHKARVRAERAALLTTNPDAALLTQPSRRPPPDAVTVPVSIVVDCDFEPYMTDKERVSLSSQVTRAYSDNRAARFRTHLYIAGFNGRLRDRFDNVLQAQYRSWKGASVFSGDFLSCTLEARARMATMQTTTTTTTTTEEEAEEKEKDDKTEQSQQVMIGPLQRSLDTPALWTRDQRDPFPIEGPEPALDQAYADVVYLTSDSPYTLERLEPHTTYVVGGLVDKNREKGLCYRRARERGVRTARLPIARFMVMQSRQVLATNHVVEILLRWLELEDWGAAFLRVIPKRKGGRLRGEEGGGEVADEVGDEEAVVRDQIANGKPGGDVAEMSENTKTLHT